MQITLPIINAEQRQEYYFGPQGFHLLTTPEAMDEAKGSLQQLHDQPLPPHIESWTIVAQDTELGDPYFIDQSDFTSAVYTTVPGNWTKVLVATSVEKFIASLKFLNDASPQEQAQFVPDEKTITDEKVLAELEVLISKLSGANHFWTDFFTCYKAWLFDDDDEFEPEYDAE